MGWKAMEKSKSSALPSPQTEQALESSCAILPLDHCSCSRHTKAASTAGGERSVDVARRRKQQSAEIRRAAGERAAQRGPASSSGEFVRHALVETAELDDDALVATVADRLTIVMGG